MTKVQLLQMKNAKIPIAERVDIADVKVDPNMPIAARLEQYCLQIKNPYAFKCGGIAVNICFSENGKTLNDALSTYLTALKNNK